MKGLKIGHSTNQTNGTGATVFIFDRPATAVYHLCGSAPATIELNPLELDAEVTHIDGMALLGGSAFGLAATAGMMRWFQEQDRGWRVPDGHVPIVPAAAIYDLSVGSKLPPTADEVYAACHQAKEGDFATGRVGAGTGASVGKLFHELDRMTGGLGVATTQLPGGLEIVVFAVVNCVGDVVNDKGHIIAGAKLPSGEFANSQKLLLSGEEEERLPSANTTLVAVFTNGKFERPGLKRIAKMAVAGMGRAISPVFTRYDGDIVFAISLGDVQASELVVGTAAAALTQQAILTAVQQSEVIHATRG